MELSKKALEARRKYLREYRRNMSQKARDKEREYLREWRSRNKDKVQQHNISFWERKARETNVDTVNVTDKSISGLSVSCQECGAQFTPKRRDAKFCSTPCRVRFNRKHAEKWKN